MELVKDNSLSKKIKELLPQLRFRPDTGRLWLDLIFLLAIIIVQITIIPSLLGRYLLDIVTPWLVVCFVRQSLAKATFLAFIAAITLENHSSAPAGLYLCTYWILLNTIIFFRPNLSWRHNISWIVVFTISELWLIAFEIFLVIFTGGSEMFNIYLLLEKTVSLLLAVTMGMFFYRKSFNFKGQKE